MTFEQEQGWQLHPIQGNTGSAYMAIKNDEKLFLKKNTSPFLAILSMEQITPRLVWTRRTENGDVLTAQEWCNGRSLTREEMRGEKVASLLSKIHHSDTLLKMLRKVGGQEMYPRHLLMDYRLKQESGLVGHPLLDEVYSHLIQNLHETQREDLRVCHSDVSHKNFLLSDDHHLYLVDWDSAMLAEPALDLGMLLSTYVPTEKWATWMQAYGVKLTPTLSEKMIWYALMVKLLSINEACSKQRYHVMNDRIKELHVFFEKIKEVR